MEHNKDIIKLTYVCKYCGREFSSTPMEYVENKYCDCCYNERLNDFLLKHAPIKKVTVISKRSAA